MSNVLVQLIKAYRDEGYEISVGLSPWRESADGPFAMIMDPTRGHKGALPKNYYINKHLPAIEHVLQKTDSFVQSFKQILNVALKKNKYTKSFYSKKKLDAHLKQRIFGDEFLSLYLDTGGGIAVDEIYFFDSLIKSFSPQKTFQIGIAAGWSTIAFGLMNPKMKIYGMDNLSEGKMAEWGMDLTKTIAQKLNLDLIVHIGASPGAVPDFFKKIGTTVDFVFIDGLHTNQQMFLDFEATLPYVSRSSIIVCHDVLNWRMLDGWEKVVEVGSKEGFKSKLLRRTSSGLGVLYRDINADSEAIIEAFSQGDQYPSRGQALKDMQTYNELFHSLVRFK